jgi:hypothetical protein
MKCVGSVALIRQLELHETDEPEYRAEGTAAHWGLATALEAGEDAYMVVGQKHENGVIITPDMARAIQTFIDFARPLMVNAVARYIEYPMARPEFHKKFFGTVDFAAVNGTTLDIADFKFGEGVAVEVGENVQTMYYAYGVLALHPEVENVRITIIQPRITWHPGGVVRSWECSAQYLRDWASGVLQPSMVRADNNDGGLVQGEWCRFCPAKLVCPVLRGLFEAAVRADARQVVTLTDADIDRDYPLLSGAKQYIKAFEGEAFRRANNGAEFEEIKLVKMKADRAWKPEAKDVFVSNFGDEAFEPASLKSPARMEKIGDAAKRLVHEFAFTPDSGLTLALKGDKRVGVKVKTNAELFPPQATENW